MPIPPTELGIGEREPANSRTGLRAGEQSLLLL